MEPGTFDELPIAALRAREGRIVAANAAYLSLMSVSAETLVGRSLEELLAERIDDATPGETWCRLLDGAGRRRSVRVLLRQRDDETIAFLVDDGGARDARDAAEALARAGTELAKSRTEDEVLERAAEALAERGYTATFFRIVPGDPLLAYGPTRSPGGRTMGAELAAERVPRAVIEQLNPRFHEGRAVFIPSFDQAVDVAYAPPLAEPLKKRKPGRHVMQAPIFVAGEPYGAFVLTSDAISPALAGAAEIFAAVVARTIENLRMHADLVQRERMAAIGEAAAVMAHEVRNPIAALLNAATLLHKREGDAGELLDIVREEARALDRVVTHLLALGRPITPRIVVEDLRHAATRAIAAARAQYPGASIELHESAVDAAVDPDLVQIAALNLLRNALEASPPGAPVEVFVGQEEGRPALRVDDRGPGIPGTLASRVFEPFFTTRPAGTGIGLAAVRRIVEACGGTVKIATSDDGGARVILLFSPPVGN